MKILITGSQGVLGSRLGTVLRGNGHHVFGVDLFHSGQSYGQVLGQLPDENYCRCDISEYRHLSEVLRHFRPDFVYNCAAEFGRWNGERYYEPLWKTNVIGFRNLISLQEELKFRVIQCSSSEVYGDYQHVMHEDVLNDHPILQMNDYALSKRVNENQIHNSTLTSGTETVILRLFNTYGPGEWYHPFRSVNCVFSYRLLHNQPIVVYGDHIRSSIYIDDAVSSMCNVVENFVPGEIYNIAAESSHTIEELSTLILEETNADPNLVKRMADHEPQTTRNKVAKSDKARRHLGLRDTVALREGVRRTIEWMRDYYRL